MFCLKRDKFVYSTSILGTGDINTDWKCWKNSFLSTVSEYIPKTQLSGRNPLPWIKSSILHLIKKKESVRRRLKAKATQHQQEKFKRMRSEVKRLLRVSQENYFSSINVSFNNNPKRFWSVLSKSQKPVTFQIAFLCLQHPVPPTKFIYQQLDLWPQIHLR